MTEITLYNTRTRTKEPFVPIDWSEGSKVPEADRQVRMYVCGPTVYDRAHIGNARPVVVFDTLFRLLRHEYGADHVTYVRNITDVDDKIIARAAESGREIDTITEETTRWYHEDMAAIGALRPTEEPRATAYIGQMIAMISALIERGHAYQAKGHVLFDVKSYPDYGRFSHRSLDEMQAGARVEVAPYKRDPMDFVLWKPSDVATPGWDSPWGRGRPGWHIECSAMSEALLGTSFDIHGGGIDLMFPHHENEIAQSLCAHPGSTFANVWMHNGFLNVEGEKMSKSLGNFFTVRDLINDGIEGRVIRWVLLSTHYREPIDWTDKKVSQAKAFFHKVNSALRFSGDELLPPDRAILVDPDLLAALRDDLNTPEAISVVSRLADSAGSDLSKRRGLAFAMTILGFRRGFEYDIPLLKASIRKFNRCFGDVSGRFTSYDFGGEGERSLYYLLIKDLIKKLKSDESDADLGAYTRDRANQPDFVFSDQKGKLTVVEVKRAISSLDTALDRITSLGIDPLAALQESGGEPGMMYVRGLKEVVDALNQLVETDTFHNYTEEAERYLDRSARLDRRYVHAFNEISSANGKIEARLRKRAEKDYEGADRIREELGSKGIALLDTVSGTRWKLK